MDVYVEVLEKSSVGEELVIAPINIKND